jgi:hypothetical protein
VKRLHPFLPEIVKVLERCGELQLSEPTKALLLKVSRSTIDRCLGPARFEHPQGLSTTKPGSLLKKAIPVRTYTPWDEDQPGFLEIDMVAHCGQTTEGQYLNTLTCVDPSTGGSSVRLYASAPNKPFAKPFRACALIYLLLCSALTQGLFKKSVL